MSGSTTDTFPDLRYTLEGRELIGRLTDLVASVEFINDEEPPEVFKRYWHSMTRNTCIECKWAKIRAVYRSIHKRGFRSQVVIGRRPNVPHLRILDGTKRTAILAALDRPIPFRWEETDD